MLAAISAIIDIRSPSLVRPGLIQGRVDRGGVDEQSTE
jgi:hypothetical protein